MCGDALQFPQETGSGLHLEAHLNGQIEDENHHWEERGNAAEVVEHCSGKQGRQYYCLAMMFSVVDSYCNVNSIETKGISCVDPLG
jgi:hypothetical protein